MKFAEIITLLRDRDGWRLACPSRFGDDEATYRDSNIYTYLDCAGVRFRRYDAYGDRVVYEHPNILASLLLWYYTLKLRRYLKRAK